MMSCKKCQCGATPRFYAVRGKRIGRRRAAQRERLVCPFCGNATSAAKSRETLREEWNSAGWCGQAEVEIKSEVGSQRSEVRGQRSEVGKADSKTCAYATPFEVFAELHPHEAYELDPDRMVAYAQKRNPALSAEGIKRLLAETEGGAE